ncbi:MAG: shikimate dehydrogenase [Nanoarchaeota archaeon]
MKANSLFGLIANPIEHSFSPILHNLIFEKLQLKYYYSPFKLNRDSFSEQFYNLISIENLKGLNISVPFKEKSLNLLSKLNKKGKIDLFVSKEVNKIRAINTIKIENKRIEVYNTDFIGFTKTLKQYTIIKNKNVFVLGAGGSSRAIIYSLKKEKANIFIWNRTIEKAQKLALEFNLELIKDLNIDFDNFDIIVNTTSVGLKEDKLLFDSNKLKNHQIVFDLIYKETLLLKEAKRKGLTTINGLDMLFYQGIESQKIWFKENKEIISFLNKNENKLKDLFIRRLKNFGLIK